MLAVNKSAGIVSEIVKSEAGIRFKNQAKVLAPIWL